MKEIVLADGRRTQVSDCDWLWLVGLKWFPGNEYAQTTISGKKEYMHIMIAYRMNLDCSDEIDHKDRNRLNNQRDNLREATHSQNLANGSMRSSNTSGLIGVSWNKRKQKWAAEITVRYKKIFLGYFDDKIAAGDAYSAAAKLHFGEFSHG